MKKVILFVLFAITCVALLAQDKMMTISNNAKFYLVTCEPGDAVYARFGHSGIRVYNPENKIDNIFHWGLFSFDTPNFIGRFTSGNTDYEMGVFGTKYFMQEYIMRGSSVYAQELDLTTEQKHALWNKLWSNYRPENRKYRYNFIYDNCATRPYLLIISSYNNKTTLAIQENQITYRDIINRYVPIGSPLNTGINLIIGSQADKYITTKESISFPMYTMNALNYTHYITHDGSTKPIVLTQEVMHRAPYKNFEVSNWLFYGLVIIPLLLAIICIIYTFKKKHYLPYLSQLMLFATGFIGIVISYLWFCSHHPLVDNNLNILWCNPFNVIFAILLFIHKKPIIHTIKVVLSTLSLILCITFLVTLIADIQTTTPQIFAIWVLILVINTTIVYTYRYKIKALLHKK